MSKKQRIKDQIKSLKNLIEDLELSLAEQEDVGKTSDTEDIREYLKKLEKECDESKHPCGPRLTKCDLCGQSYFGSWHSCNKTATPPWCGSHGYKCACGQWVGSMQVHTCPWSPGITCIIHG